MKAEKIFGFASCALGLLPLVAQAQQSGGISCQGSVVVSASATGGASTTVPVLVNPAAGSIVLCGYALTEVGPTTQGAQLVYGGGSACAAILGFSQTPLSVNLTGPTAAGASAYVARNGMGVFLSQGASICLKGTITTMSVEINYSLQ